MDILDSISKGDLKITRWCRIVNGIDVWEDRRDSLGQVDQMRVPADVILRQWIEGSFRGLWVTQT